MKKLSILIALIILIQLSLLSQQNRRDKIQEPLFFKVTTHDSNIRELPAKSFYKSKSDWQYIIDTTWGPGLPLAEKQQIFNTYANSIREDFDGFESLNMNGNAWDSLRAHYYGLIDDSTR